MSKTYLIVIAAALMAAPLVMAHDPAGTPKNYCESTAEFRLHEYGPPASGVLLQGYEDGNVFGDCDGSGLDLGNPGTPCAGFDDPNDPLTFYAGLCDSNILLPAADYDGHAEYARGGAWILACNGDGTAFGGTCGDGVGAGSEWCFGAPAHHTEQGTVTVTDVAFSTGVTFYVAADHNSGLFGDPCGDFESDVGQSYNDPNDPTAVYCPTGNCPVPFNAGLDGSYQVYVTGTQGHVDWP